MEEIKEKIFKKEQWKVYLLFIFVGALTASSYYNIVYYIGNSDTENLVNTQLKPSWEQQNITNVNIEEIKKYSSDFRYILLNYTSPFGQDMRQSVIISTDGNYIWFDKNPQVYPFIQPFEKEDKQTMLTLIDLQEKLGFELEPGYVITEIQNAIKDQITSCYTTDSSYGVNEGFTFCSKNGKEEVYESAFQRAIYENYGYTNWKQYFINWANCTTGITPCREESFNKLNINRTIMADIINYKNMPSIMHTESQQNVSKTTIIIDQKEYTGKDFKEEICSKYNLMTRNC